MDDAQERLRIFNLLSENLSWLETLSEAIQVEKDLEKEYQEKGYGPPPGWQWHMVHCPIPVLHKMVAEKLLDITLSTRSSKYFRVRDPELVTEVIEFFQKEEEKAETAKEVPEDLFAQIVGHDNIKTLLRLAIDAESPAHVLLSGPPASAKTLFLLELNRLPDSYYALAPTLTEAGLSNLLFIYRPKFLIVDELDRLPGSELGQLNSLMATGRVCLPQGEILLSNPTVKRIEDFSPRDTVLNKEGLYQEVLEVHQRDYCGDLISIKPFYLPCMRVTPDHLVWAIKGIRCKYNGLHFCHPNCGKEHLRQSCGEPFKNYQPRWIPARDLQYGDYVYYPINPSEKHFTIDFLEGYDEPIIVEHGCLRCLGSRKSRDSGIPRFVKASPELATILGWYVAEGSCPGGEQVSFALGFHERQEANELACLIWKVFTKRARVSNRRTCITVTFKSKIIAHKLSRDFGNSAETKRIPQYIWNGPRDFIKHFLRAYFKGDGWITQNVGSASTVSKTLAYQIVGLYAKLGGLLSLETNKPNKSNLAKLPIHQVHAYGTPWHRLWDNLPDENAHSMYWQQNGAFWFPIRSVRRETYCGKVYNLSTEDETYLGSFLVHNCETKWGKTRTVELDTKVFAAGIRINRLPQDLLSRFIKLRFPAYTQDGFISVSTTVLTVREGITPERAQEIARAIWEMHHEQSDVRQCVSIARLSGGDPNKVKEVLHTIKKYGLPRLDQALG